MSEKHRKKAWQVSLEKARNAERSDLKTLYVRERVKGKKRNVPPLLIEEAYPR